MSETPEGHPQHCSLCEKRWQAEVEGYMKALMTSPMGSRAERERGADALQDALDRAWEKLSSYAKAEVSRRLGGS